VEKFLGDPLMDWDVERTYASVPKLEAVLGEITEAVG
jgi:hypothetical protein